MAKVFKYSFIIILSILCFGFVIVTQFAYVFPIKELDIVNRYAKESNLSPCMVLSVINIESGFDMRALSHVGAIGLMQLKIDTANDMANICNDASVTVDKLYDKNLNIKYGCMYLRYLLDYYKDEKLALCAYNAGLGNVNSWLDNSQYIDENGKLIVIPYGETSKYIEKYEKNYRVYTIYSRLGLLKK